MAGCGVGICLRFRARLGPSQFGIHQLPSACTEFICELKLNNDDVLLFNDARRLAATCSIGKAGRGHCGLWRLRKHLKSAHNMFDAY